MRRNRGNQEIRSWATVGGDSSDEIGAVGSTDRFDAKQRLPGKRRVHPTHGGLCGPAALHEHGGLRGLGRLAMPDVHRVLCTQDVHRTRRVPDLPDVSCTREVGRVPSTHGGPSKHRKHRVHVGPGGGDRARSAGAHAQGRPLSLSLVGPREQGGLYR